ncbi:hypothetical protein BJX65DRAFT_306095 [Aspergillus insuetus]|uniref:Stress-response A/B barrel domain-containing protein n=1 Tax=Aspergillus keveii TaxID=714993 RepID=A0ABR4G9K1_9EURO
MPITHIVLFQFKAEVSTERIEDVCTRMIGLKNSCIHPTTQRPYILASSGGVDNSPEGLQSGITHAFVVEFASAQDRDYYVERDPAHREFVRSLDGLLEKSQVIDYSNGSF